MSNERKPPPSGSGKKPPGEGHPPRPGFVNVGSWADEVAISEKPQQLASAMQEAEQVDVAAEEDEAPTSLARVRRAFGTVAPAPRRPAARVPERRAKGRGALSGVLVVLLLVGVAIGYAWLTHRLPHF